MSPLALLTASSASFFTGFGFVQVLAADGGVGQHGHTTGLHFHDATGHKDELFFLVVGALDAHGTRLDARDQRCVLGQDAQLTHFTGHGHHRGFAREDGLFGRNNINVNGGHMAS